MRLVFGIVGRTVCAFSNFSSVRVTEWPPIGEKLRTRLTICFLCIST